MAESKLEGFAGDLGRLIGTTQAKAESWLGQRKQIVQNLTQLRNTVNGLLTQMGEGVERIRRGRGGRRKQEFAPAPKTKYQRRKLSAKARKAISDAQKKRWAAVRAAKK